jgi:hypothetical protein
MKRYSLGWYRDCGGYRRSLPVRPLPREPAPGLIKVRFEVGERGLIGRNPSDGGPFVVIDRRPGSGVVTVLPDIPYEVFITRTNETGRTRFGYVLRRLAD